jgi:hypothetical protein
VPQQLRHALGDHPRGDKSDMLGVMNLRERDIESCFNFTPSLGVWKILKIYVSANIPMPDKRPEKTGKLKLT